MSEFFDGLVELVSVEGWYWISSSTAIPADCDRLLPGADAGVTGVVTRFYDVNNSSENLYLANQCDHSCSVI